MEWCRAKPIVPAEALLAFQQHAHDSRGQTSGAGLLWSSLNAPGGDRVIGKLGSKLTPQR